MRHSSLGSDGGHPVLATTLHVCTLSWPPSHPASQGLCSAWGWCAEGGSSAWQVAPEGLGGARASLVSQFPSRHWAPREAPQTRMSLCCGVGPGEAEARRRLLGLGAATLQAPHQVPTPIVSVAAACVLCDPQTPE